MTTLGLRLPNSLHTQLREYAKREGVSMNQFITTVIAEKLAAMTTAEYLEHRAARGDKDRFAAILAKVPDSEPADGDKM